MRYSRVGPDAAAVEALNKKVNKKAIKNRD